MLRHDFGQKARYEQVRQATRRWRSGCRNPIRTLRDHTCLRTELVEERSRNKQRLEKLLEDALIKLSSVATDLLGVSSREMIESLIACERDPEVLAGLARGKLRDKRTGLVEALNGRFDDHACTDKVDRLGTRIEVLVADLGDPAPRPSRARAPTNSHPVGASVRRLCAPGFQREPEGLGAIPFS